MIDNYNIYFSCNMMQSCSSLWILSPCFYISGVHCARTLVQEADFATNFAASSNGPWRPGRVAVWRLLWCRGWTKHDESIGHLNVGYEIFNDQIIFFEIWTWPFSTEMYLRQIHLIPIGFVDGVHQRIVSYDPCSYGDFCTSTAPGIMIQQFEISISSVVN